MTSLRNKIAKFIKEPGKCKIILAYLFLGLAMPLLNVFLALAYGMPKPFVHDEFSYLFMADTFALGRVVNSEHPFSQFFQTFHIIQHDGIYASKYFPGIGVQLLIGKLLGHPIIGVWLTVGLFGVSLLFFLRQYFSASVAFLVSLIFSLQFMVMSYFGNSYWGGSLMALAGIWTLGGAVLAAKHGQLRYAWISGVGLVMCILTRPFESFFYLIPLSGVLLFSLLRGSNIFGWRWSWRLIAPMITGIVFGLLLLGIYNRCITGNWKTFPYTVYAKAYAPYGVLFLGEHSANQTNDAFFESLPAPFHQMQNRYIGEYAARTHFFFAVKMDAASRIASFLFPLAISWMFVAAFIPKTHWKNRLWLLCIATIIMRLGPLLLSWSSTLAHYSASWIFPIAVLCAFGLEWLFSVRFVRHFALIIIVATLAWLAEVYLASFNTQIDLPWKDRTSYLPRPMNVRSTVESYLEKNLAGKSLVFVEYTSDHIPDWEWVYNSPKIDAQKVVWAHDLGKNEDQRLINYYSGREVWLAIVPTLEPVVLKHWNKSEEQFDSTKSFDWQPSATNKIQP